MIVAPSKHIDRKDHKLIKRFTETRLGDEKFRELIDHIKKITLCYLYPWMKKQLSI